MEVQYEYLENETNTWKLKTWLWKLLLLHVSRCSKCCNQNQSSVTSQVIIRYLKWHVHVNRILIKIETSSPEGHSSKKGKKLAVLELNLLWQSLCERHCEPKLENPREEEATRKETCLHWNYSHCAVCLSSKVYGKDIVFEKLSSNRRDIIIGHEAFGLNTLNTFRAKHQEVWLKKDGVGYLVKEMDV